MSYSIGHLTRSTASSSYVRAAYLPFSTIADVCGSITRAAPFLWTVLHGNFLDHIKSVYATTHLSVMTWTTATDLAFARSALGHHFRLGHSSHQHAREGSCFLTEVNAGLATFFAMSYIISVNAQIVSQSGGTCVCTSTADLECANDASYLQCIQEVNQDLVTATAAISALASIAVGVLANLPVAIAPGMGLNTFFAYQVVGFHGSGPLSFQLATTAVFVEGLISFAITLLGLRSWLVRIIPSSLKVATGVGIGLYIALIGFSYGAGIGAITGGSSDPLRLGGCDTELLDPVTGQCTSGQLQSPKLWVAIFCGGVVTSFLMLYRVRGAIIYGTLLTSIVSWPRGTCITNFPYTPSGDASFAFFRQVITFHPIKHIWASFAWTIPESQSGQFVLAVVTFLYVDILDLTATLYSMARFAGALAEETQDFEGSTAAYLVNAACISLGAVVGCPPLTVFVESGAGIAEGGKTGVTACVTGLCFLISVFFAPIFASIPSWATGCTLILVGAMMARAVVDINWRYMGDSVPAFLTLITMPFTYSIAYGLITGVVTHAILNGGAHIMMKISNGWLVPDDYDLADTWSASVHYDVVPKWLSRLVKGIKGFSRDEFADVGQEPETHRRPKGSFSTSSHQATMDTVVESGLEMGKKTSV